ncbi:MAG: GNAT family N-acetyltransferase [Dehalococcoidales bacterium]|nr:GNAT family N-acetyltransferase [Dehalococcoidales bacterium]
MAVSSGYSILHTRMADESFTIRPVSEADKDWINSFLEEYWGSTRFVTRGRLFFADENPGFFTFEDDKPVSLITYEIIGNECEITTLTSLAERKGIGTALINAVKDVALQAGCKRLVVITTNDNTHAIRFYQRYGFTIATIYPNSMEEARKIKPEIPLTGNDGIPLRDEIEFEIHLLNGKGGLPC